MLYRAKKDLQNAGRLCFYYLGYPASAKTQKNGCAKTSLRQKIGRRKTCNAKPIKSKSVKGNAADILSRLPAHFLPRKNVNMKVRNGLPCIIALVDYKPITVFKPQEVGKFGDFL